MPHKNAQLRIIGGQWRGRKLNFADEPGVRPTADRVRETLFNWLMVDIEGARCLDLFAGSGALGLEALSRGAKEVVFIDSNSKVINTITAQLKTLGADNAKVIKQTAESYLGLVIPKPFDIVFLDPPFHKDFLLPIIQQLIEGNWLKEETLVYIEAEKNLGAPELPEGWGFYKSKIAGQVSFYLAKKKTIRRLG